jgi:Protein of unknown function (DUF2971)
MIHSMNFTDNILFKYRFIRTDDGVLNRYTERIVKNGELYFASPSSFDDPHDCRVSVVPKNCPDRLERLKVLAKQAFLYVDRKYDVSGLSFEQMCEVSHQMTEYINSILTEDGYFSDHIIDRFSKHFGVLSLTKDYLDTLMWSKYADNHKGVCFGFDKSETPFKHAKEVLYCDEMPLLESDDLSSSDLFVLTKEKKWEFQKEFRVARKGSGPILFNKKAIKLTLFGCKTSHEDIEEVKSWFRAESLSCEFMKIKRVQGRFDLSTELI